MAVRRKNRIDTLYCLRHRVCAGEAVGGEVRVRPPLVVFDGCHRGAAWILRGSADPIAARLVLTEQPP